MLRMPALLTGPLRNSPCYRLTAGRSPRAEGPSASSSATCRAEGISSGLRTGRCPRIFSKTLHFGPAALDSLPRKGVQPRFPALVVWVALHGRCLPRWMKHAILRAGAAAGSSGAHSRGAAGRDTPRQIRSTCRRCSASQAARVVHCRGNRPVFDFWACAGLPGAGRRTESARLSSLPVFSRLAMC